MPEKALKTYENTLLYSKKSVTITGSRDRRLNNDDDTKNRSDPNLHDRIDKFKNVINQKRVYRIPLRYLIYIGWLTSLKISARDSFSCLKITIVNYLSLMLKLRLPYQNQMSRSIFMERPIFHIGSLNFEVYFNSSLRSKKFLRTGIKMTSYQQSFEISTGMQSVNVNFIGSNRQFLILEISLVYNKSDRHQTIFDSYEIAATKLQSLKFENASNTYSLTSKIKYDIDNEDDKYLLYAKFAAFNSGGCTISPLTDYANNEV